LGGMLCFQKVRNRNCLAA
jgi:hypothetical protein